MTSLERTLNFIENKPVDTLPFHPIIMQFAAQYCGSKYKDFCLNYECKASCMIKCADDFGLDWVTVMSDAYAEAEAFGLQVDYPDDSLPVHSGQVIGHISDVNFLRVPDMSASYRMINRVNEVGEFSRLVGDNYFIVGWVEGPMAEYADLRGLSDACLDLYDHENEVNIAMDIILENAMIFARTQVSAGAHCIGIGDAACSQIGPAMYRQYVFEREKQLISYIQSLGAITKLHVCGNTTPILPDLIATGANIIDVDHLVVDMSLYVTMLGDNQVLSGNSDPVEVVMQGSQELIYASVKRCYEQTVGRGIISAGCEIPRQTSAENFRAYCAAARCQKLSSY